MITKRLSYNCFLCSKRIIMHIKNHFDFRTYYYHVNGVLHYNILNYQMSNLLSLIGNAAI